MKNLIRMTTIEKIEKGIITLAEFREDQQSFIRGIVKLSFNEGQEQALRIQDVVGQSEQLLAVAEYVYNHFDDSSSKTAKDYLQDFLSQ